MIIYHIYKYINNYDRRMILLYIFIYIYKLYILYISDMHINNILYGYIFENLTGSRFLFFIDVQSR